MVVSLRSMHCHSCVNVNPAKTTGIPVLVAMFHPNHHGMMLNHAKSMWCNFAMKICWQSCNGTVTNIMSPQTNITLYLKITFSNSVPHYTTSTWLLSRGNPKIQWLWNTLNVFPCVSPTFFPGGASCWRDAGWRWRCVCQQPVILEAADFGYDSELWVMSSVYSVYPSSAFVFEMENSWS